MRKSFLHLHIAVLLAGFTAILGKLIGLNEGLLVWYRLLITVVVLAALLLPGRRIQPINQKDILRIFPVGLIISLHWVLFYGSVKYGNASIAVVCFSATGFFTAIFEPVFFRRRIDPVEVFLGLLTIAGIYIIFDFHPQYKTGILFGIVSAIGSSIYPIFNKRLLTSYNPATITFYEMAAGLLTLTLLVPLYLLQFPAEYYLPTPADWLWLSILACACTVLSFFLQLSALKKISPFTSNIAYNMEPIYGIVLAFVIFHENKLLGSYFYVGVALIMLSVMVQTGRVWFTHRQVAGPRLAGRLDA